MKDGLITGFSLMDGGSGQGRFDLLIWKKNQTLCWLDIGGKSVHNLTGQ